MAFPSSALTTVSEYERSSYLQKCGHLLAVGFGVAAAISCILLAISTVAIWQVRSSFGRRRISKDQRTPIEPADTR